MLSGVFQDAVESSAKVFGRKEVRVLFEGSEAKTDGGTVYLPALPPSSEINVEQADIIRGFRDHESMHVRCTDTSKEVLNLLEQASQKNPHMGKLIQYCEDVRIENAGIQEYPGMKIGLSATNTHAAKMLLKQIEEKGNPTEVVTSLPGALRFRLMLQAMSRADIGVSSGGVFESLVEIMKQHDPKLYDLARKFATKMTELPTGVKGSKLDEKASKKGTLESFNLAQEIFAAYTEHEEDNPPPPPSQGGDDGDEQSDGGGSGNGGGANGKGDSGDAPGGDQGSGDSESDQPGDGQGGGNGGGKSGQDGDGDDGNQGQGGGGQGGSGGGGDGSDDDSSERDEGSRQDPTVGSGGGGGNSHSDGGATDATGSIGPDVSDIDDDDLRKKALDDVVDQISGQKASVVDGKVLRRGLFQVWSRRFYTKVSMVDAVSSMLGKSSYTRNKLVSDAIVNAARIESEISGKRAMIRRILELELQARHDRRWEAGHKHGRLQSIRVVDAMQGRETVYQRRHDGKDMDTLLHISIDGSGSMNGERAQSSAMLALALSEALERTGCDIQVEMWGSSIYTGPGATYSKRDVDDSACAWQDDYYNRLNEAGDRGEPHNPRYVSVGVLTKAVMKSKRQRTNDQDVKAAFGMAHYSLRSGTPSFHAVFSDLGELAKEQYAKKIYLHITDGDADYPIERHKPSELMEEAHQLAERAGVHMIGVGITGMRVSHLFKDSIEVRGADAYEPVIRRLAKLIAEEGKHGSRFQRAA